MLNNSIFVSAFDVIKNAGKRVIFACFFPSQRDSFSFSIRLDGKRVAAVMEKGGRGHNRNIPLHSIKGLSRTADGKANDTNGG